MTSLPPDQYITIGSIKTRYWTLGHKGPVLIFVHGILRFVEDWRLNIEVFAQDYRVYAVDLVGYGRTDKPDIAYSPDDMIEFMRDFMTALEIKRATLVGHSMGGGVILGLADRYPELVERLVLVASAGFGPEIHAAFRLASLPWPATLFVRPNRFVITRAFKEVFYDSTLITPDLIDFTRQMFSLPGAKGAFLRMIRANVNFRGVRPAALAEVRVRLSALTMPTLIIWGRQDKILPVAHAQVAAVRLPNARLYLLDECGHFPMIEHPNIFNALVREFLAVQTAPVYDQAQQPVAVAV